MKLKHHLRTILGDFRNTIRQPLTLITPTISSQPRKVPKSFTYAHQNTNIHTLSDRKKKVDSNKRLKRVSAFENPELPDFSLVKTASNVMPSPGWTTWVRAQANAVLDITFSAFTAITTLSAGTVLVVRCWWLTLCCCSIFAGNILPSSWRFRENLETFYREFDEEILARLAFIGDVRVRRKWLLKGLKWSAVYSLKKK